MNAHYAMVAGRAGHRCEYCRAPEVLFNFPFEVEHVVPASRGRSNEESNLALACRACNIFKADALTGYDPDSNSEVTLFHPRRDLWEEHFLVEADDGVIEGVTASGRATVARLRMNSELQIAARSAWIQLGLFP